MCIMRQSHSPFWANINLAYIYSDGSSMFERSRFCILPMEQRDTDEVISIVNSSPGVLTLSIVANNRESSLG